MKDHLAAVVRDARSAVEGRSLAREYVQALILAALQRAGAMVPLAFQGGTALRFLYAIPRYSEDLDFALERRPELYDFRGMLAAITTELGRTGYATDCKVSDRRVVHSAFVRFPGLLHEIGLSARREEVLAVKIEVDTRPPSGAGVQTTIVRRHVVLRLQHHDKASLLAGKLHAVLQRPYLKGRDIFDLVWYLSDPSWPGPNLALLNDALRQTRYEGRALTGRTWKRAVRDRVTKLDLRRLADDVRPFLESQVGDGLITQENLLRLLR